MELSTRDRVALAAYTEIKEGRGTPNGGVWLDVSHLPRETIMTRLPRVYQTMLELQMLDITTDPIEIAPTAHYSMGGVWVRPEDHSTDVAGPLRHRRGIQRTARREPARRQLADRAARLRPHRRPGGGRVLGGARPRRPRSAAAVAEARAEIDDLLAADGRRERARPAARDPQHHDRARRRRPRRGRAARRARRARRDRGADGRHRHPPRHRRLPGPRARLRPEVGRRSPRAPRSRRRSSAGRPAAATTAATTPTSTRRCRSTSCGRPRPASRARRSRRSRRRSPALMREVVTAGKLVE